MSKTIVVEFDFTNPDKPRDWSVVAWGTQSDVYVYHDKGWVGSHLT